MSPANRLPELDALFRQDDLVEALESVFPEGVRLSRGTRGRTLKLQRNAGASPSAGPHNPGDRIHLHILRISVFINAQSFEGCVFIDDVYCCCELC